MRYYVKGKHNACHGSLNTKSMFGWGNRNAFPRWAHHQTNVWLAVIVIQPYSIQPLLREKL
ncbi:hypothetical protein V6Z12_D12G272000 [Gossypium hirsutum]